MNRKLHKALKDQKKQNKQENLQIPGSLGVALGGQLRVEVPNRNAFVYVKLRDNPNEVIQAFNNKVSPSYGLPVLVERQDGRFVVVSVDTIRYQNNWNSFAPFLPRHGNSHSGDFESGGGGDMVFVHPRQFVPALIFPSGSLGAPNVYMYPYLLHNNDGSWKYVGNTGTPNITTYNPTASGTAVMVLVYLDADSGNPYLIVNSGTTFSSLITGTAQLAPYIPSVSNPNYIPLAAIRLVTGSSSLSWNNIYDTRQFLHPTPTGSSGGGGSINTGTLNSLYLRLDASNDPVTDQLDIVNAHAGNGGIFVQTEGDSFTADIEQYNSTQDFASSPALFVHRQITNNKTSAGAHLYLNEVSNTTGTFTGETIRVRINATDRAAYYPHAFTSGTSLYFDTLNTITPAGKLLSLQNVAVEKFAVGGDGTTNIPTGSTYNIGGTPHTHAGGSTMFVQDEGILLGGADTLNFVGNFITATLSGTVARIMVTGSVGGHVIMITGTAMPQRPNLNFTGLGVTATDSSVTNRTTIDINAAMHTVNQTAPGFDSSPVNNYDSAKFDKIVAVASNVPIELTGISGGVQDQVIIFQSHATLSTFNITLKNADARSSSQNQFRLPGAKDFVVSPGDTVFLQWAGSAFWIIVGAAAQTIQGVRVDPQVSTGMANNSIFLYSGTSMGASDTLLTGWLPKMETWSRTGNHTFNISGSGDVTAAYRKGAFIRYKDGGSYEYGVIGSSSFASSMTTVNLIPNTNYTMAAATITDRYISYIHDPEGFPRYFDYQPTFAGSATAGNPTGTVTLARWSPVGVASLNVNIDVALTAVGGATGTLAVSIPIASVVSTVGAGRENAVTGSMLQLLLSNTGTNFIIFIYNNGATLVAGYQIIGGATYAY